MFQYIASVPRTTTEHETLNHWTHWTCINPFLARTFSVRPATAWWWHTNSHLTFIFSLLFWIQRVLILMWYLWNVHTTCSTSHSKNM